MNLILKKKKKKIKSTNNDKVLSLKQNSDTFMIKKGKQDGDISQREPTRKNIPGVRNLGKLRHRRVGSCISSPESVTSQQMTRKLQCDALKHHQRLPKSLVHL